MIDESSRPRQLIRGVAPHPHALESEFELVSHTVLRRRLILLFALLIGQKYTIVIAYYFVLLEVSKDFDSSTPVRQVVNYLEALPCLTGHQVRDSAMLQVQTHLCTYMVKIIFRLRV